MFRPIWVDHTNYFQVAIKTHSFISDNELMVDNVVCIDKDP